MTSARAHSSGFLAAWFATTAVLLLSLGGYVLQAPVWVRGTPRTTALVWLTAAYGVSGAVIVALRRRRGELAAAEALQAALLVFGTAFFAVILADVPVSRFALVLVFGAALGFAVAPFMLPRSVAVLAIGLALVIAPVAAIVSRGMGTPPSAGAVREMLTPTAFYTLRATVSFADLPEDSVEGGGMSPLGDRFLLATGEGGVYVVSRAGRRIETAPTTLRVPLNTEEFRASVAGSRVDVRGFRVADFLVVEYARDSVLLLASHHVWRRKERCFVLRVSTLAGNPDTLLTSGGHAWRTLYETNPCLPLKTSSEQFVGTEAGGRMSLLDDRTLLVSVGDHQFDGVNDTAMLAQDPAGSYGKTVVVDLRSGVARIHSSGHRNPQGLVVRRDGSVWLSEHGPRGGDELNRIVAGANYGWPLETYGTNYGALSWPLSATQGRHPRYTPPAFVWVPSIGISNLIEVRGARFPLWDGDLLVGALAARALYRIRIEDDRVRFAEPINVGYSVRDLAQGRDGAIALWLDGSAVAFLDPIDSTDVSGEARFAELCTGCHVINDGTMHGVGPDLQGVLSRPIASAARFRYSPALARLRGRWSAERLDRFLRDGQAFAPGVTMPDVVANDSVARAAIVEYLRGMR